MIDIADSCITGRRFLICQSFFRSSIVAFSWGANNEEGGHAEVIVGGEPVVGGELVAG